MISIESIKNRLTKRKLQSRYTLLLYSILLFNSLLIKFNANHGWVILSKSTLPSITSPWPQFDALAFDVQNLTHGKASLLQSAQNYFKYVLANEPENVSAVNGLGQVYARQGLYDFAIDMLSKAGQIDKSNVVIPYQLGFLLWGEGRIDKAGNAWKRLSESSLDGFNRVITEEGYALANQGQISKAQDVFQKAIRLNPKSGRGYYGIAYLSFWFQNDYDKVMQIAWQGINVDPSHSLTGRLWLAQVYYKKGTIEEAITELQFAVDSNSSGISQWDEWAARYMLGSLLIEAGQARQAILYLQDSLIYWPSNNDKLRTYIALGKSNEAISYFEIAMKYYKEALQLADNEKQQIEIYDLIRALIKKNDQKNYPK